MSSFQRPHVLIVSDDLDLSQFLQEGLMYAGFFTTVVASALQTLELFRLRTFDLMMIDALLEGLGADQVVSRLREEIPETGQPRTEVPILIIAGSEQEITGDSAIEMGADGVIFSPIEIEHLAADLFGRIGRWRDEHPGRPWADQLAQARDQ